MRTERLAFTWSLSSSFDHGSMHLVIIGDRAFGTLMHFICVHRIIIRVTSNSGETYPVSRCALDYGLLV